MRRTLLLLCAFGLTAVLAAARETAPFHAGTQPDGKKPAPVDRGKIVDEIRADFDVAVGKLNKNDAGAEAQKAQRRILDNIDRLLKNDDPPPESSPPPSSSNPPPEGSPMPQQKSASENPQPNPSSPQPKGRADKLEPKPAEVDGVKGPKDASPNSLRDLQNVNLGKEEWSKLPWRPRPEMDAYGRAGFIRNYEKLLEQYYRSLADSGRREE